MQVLAALLSIWLPPNAPGQAVDDGSGTQAPATHLEDQDRTPGRGSHGHAMESTRWLVKPGLSHGAAQ